ncbi:hypothetical protein PUN28_014390 [Cardiocondyla obscurior]|uniref:Uncharacterized protein n=1 Tax=Cardiocondyla obscurior TaxID=286306 RepID=A0AAW2EZV2_9HYME
MNYFEIFIVHLRHSFLKKRAPINLFPKCTPSNSVKSISSFLSPLLGFPPAYFSDTRARNFIGVSSISSILFFFFFFAN